MSENNTIKLNKKVLYETYNIYQKVLKVKTLVNLGMMYNDYLRYLKCEILLGGK